MKKLWDESAAVCVLALTRLKSNVSDGSNVFLYDSAVAIRTEPDIKIECKYEKIL